jgi:hypothetical protein
MSASIWSVSWLGVIDPVERDKLMGDKIKTLSDAMLLGSTFRKQSYTAFYNYGRSCALGAAAEAIGINIVDPDTSITDTLHKRFPILTEPQDDPIVCPAKRCRYTKDCFSAIDYIVVHLNDDHHWKRERIAAWLQTKGL